ncbi:MAG TPA: E2/UBC family protein [Allosphingosinicella sp.]|jgi:hypothetical protein
MLPADDNVFLAARFPGHQVAVEGGMTCVLIPALQLPPGLSHSTGDLLLRLSGGYPDVPPDMFWFDPHLRRADGASIDRADQFENYLGRLWQRWSRHMNPGAWRSGTDGLRSFLTLIEKELARAALRNAA